MRDIWALRILCAYIVYALYAPHSITLNPFKSSLEEIASSIAASLQNVNDTDAKSYMSSLVGSIQAILRDRGVVVRSIIGYAFHPLLLSSMAQMNELSAHELLTSKSIPVESFKTDAGGQAIDEKDLTPPSSNNITDASTSSQSGSTIDPAWTKIASAAQSRVINLSEQRVSPFPRWKVTNLSNCSRRSFYLVSLKSLRQNFARFSPLGISLLYPNGMHA